MKTVATAPSLMVTVRASSTLADSGIVETTRVRESEIDAALWNSEIGEFMQPPQTTRLN